jgi:hypothetical protein
MNQISKQSSFRPLGFSEREISQAERLLDVLDYVPDSPSWNERRRFLLFDKLAKIAMGHAVDAERAGRSEASECGLVAQCAMEMVYRGQTFSSTLIDEICTEGPLETSPFDE